MDCGSGSRGLLPAPSPLRTCACDFHRTRLKHFKRPLLLAGPGCSYHASDHTHFLSCQNVLAIIKVRFPAWIIGVCISSDLGESDDSDAMGKEQFTYVLSALFLDSGGEYLRLAPAMPVFAGVALTPWRCRGFGGRLQAVQHHVGDRG